MSVLWNHPFQRSNNSTKNEKSMKFFCNKADGFQIQPIWLLPYISLVELIQANSLG